MPRGKQGPVGKQPAAKAAPVVAAVEVAPDQCIHAVPEAPEPVEQEQAQPLHVRAQALMKKLDRSNRHIEAGMVGSALIALGSLRSNAQHSLDKSDDAEVQDLMQEILDL